MELKLNINSITVEPRDRGSMTITIDCSEDDILDAVKESVSIEDIAAYYDLVIEED